MTSRWKIALAAAAAAAASTTAVIALADRGADPASATVPVEPTEDRRTVTVSGRGTVEVTPDIAHVSMGVQSSGPDADQVYATLGTKSTALVDSLKGLGVAEADLRTSGLSLYPTSGEDGAITGYQGSVDVDVTVRDLARLGELLDGVKGFVGPELTLGGISFDYDDPEAVLGEARVAAVEDARVRAGQFAGAADGEVGEIVRIVEGSVPMPLLEADVARAAADASFAVEPGTQELGVDVTVVFELT